MFELLHVISHVTLFWYFMITISKSSYICVLYCELQPLLSKAVIKYEFTPRLEIVISLTSLSSLPHYITFRRNLNINPLIFTYPRLENCSTDIHHSKGYV